MGNRIKNRKNYTTEQYLEKSLKMSNGLTDVFIRALALSASEKATTDREVELASWIASRDQMVFGRGAIGFDISDIPWSREQFKEEKSYLIDVIETAKGVEYWKSTPKFAEPTLEKFKALIEDFSAEFINPENLESWREEKPRPDRCSIDGVYRHWYGCVVCEDTPQPERPKIVYPTAETVKVPKEVEDEMRALLNQGEKIEAIRKARRCLMLDLKEAMKYIESLATD